MLFKRNPLYQVSNAKTMRKKMTFIENNCSDKLYLIVWIFLNCLNSIYHGPKSPQDQSN